MLDHLAALDRHQRGHALVGRRHQDVGNSRLYRESVATPLRFGPGERVPVPAAIAHFPLEAPFPPRAWIERAYDVRRLTEMPAGGHFAALERTALLAQDIRAFLL